MLKRMRPGKEGVSIFLFIFFLSFVIYLAFSSYIHFHVSLNDFWGVLYYAKHLNISEPASLYNGFYPIGYPLILHFIPYSYIVNFAFVLNILSAALLTTSVCILFNHLTRSMWGLALVFMITTFNPLFFQYAITINTDLWVAVLDIVGIYLLWRENPNHPTRDDLLAGALFGISTLLRSHAIIMAIAILLAYTAVTGRRNFWRHRSILITFVLIYLVQVIVNLISGHGPFETGQNFTAYIAFIGIMNWWHIPPEAYHFSVIDQFLRDPIGSFQVFLPLFLNLVIYGLPSLLCLPFLRSERERKFAWFSLITTILYSAPVAIGTAATDRGPIPVLGLAIICIGLLSIEIWSRLQEIKLKPKTIRALALVLFSFIVIGVGAKWRSTNLNYLIVNRNQNESFRLLETKLLGLGMKSPSEVFTNRFILYFPGIPPFRPQSNGGWENYSLWGYRKEFPELPTDSWENFVSACSAQKIKYLVLSPNSGTVADFLDLLYDGQLTPDNIRYAGKVSNMKVYVLDYQ